MKKKSLEGFRTIGGMKHRYCLILFTIAILSCNESFSQQIRWYEGPRDLGVRDIVSTTDAGGYCIMGNLKNSHPEDLFHYDGFLVKTLLSGNVEWSKIYLPTEGERIRFFSISDAPPGDVTKYAVVGMIKEEGTPHGQAWFMGVDGLGTPQFSFRLGQEGTSDVFSSIDKIGGNNPGYIMAGHTTLDFDGFSGTKMLVTKTNSNGDIEVNTIIGAQNGNVYWGSSVTTTPDNEFVVVGHTTEVENFCTSEPLSGGVVAKLDEDLNILFTRTIAVEGIFSIFENPMLSFVDVDVAENGNIAILGRYQVLGAPTSSLHAVLIVLDTNGNVLLSKFYNVTSTLSKLQPRSITIDDEFEEKVRYQILGEYGDSDRYPILFKVDELGVPIWSNHYDGPFDIETSHGLESSAKSHAFVGSAQNLVGPFDKFHVTQTDDNGLSHTQCEGQVIIVGNDLDLCITSVAEQVFFEQQEDTPLTTEEFQLTSSKCTPVALMPGEEFKIYPNPASDYFMIETSYACTEISITLFDTNEPIDMEYQKIGEYLYKIESGHLPKGIHIINISCNQEQSFSRQVIIE